MSVAPQKDWGLNGRDGCVMGPAEADRFLRLILDPDALEEVLEADRQRSLDEWHRDPLYPIRTLRAKGIEPSEATLNCLDGPAVCEVCGALNTDDDNPKELTMPEDMCYGCGHIVCSRGSCDTPSGTWDHPFTLHGAKARS